MGARYILRFDDVTPGMAWSKFLPLKQFMEEQRINCLLGVVPDCLDVNLEVEPIRHDFFDLIRHWKNSGDTIAQHGTHHLYQTEDAGLLGINPRSEFAGLPYEVQLQRIQAGKSVLEREGVWAPFFMPPSHSFDLNTIKALKASGFEAITDGVGFFPYLAAGMKLVPQLLGRPFPFAFGIITICVHVNSIESHELIRLERFIERYRDRFVRFHDLVNEPVSDTFMARCFRGMTSALLKIMRFVRKSMLGDLS